MASVLRLSNHLHLKKRMNGECGHPMAKKSYEDELTKAKRRPDLAALHRIIEHHYNSYQQLVAGKNSESEADGVDPDECDFLNLEADQDIERTLALIALALSIYEDRRYFFYLAAGPLEEILRNPSPDTLKRIVDEARKNPRFRFLLTGVWLHALSKESAAAVANMVGNMTEFDEMPPPDRA
jgi:hypothetical protein